MLYVLYAYSDYGMVRKAGFEPAHHMGTAPSRLRVCLFHHFRMVLLASLIIQLNAKVCQVYTWNRVCMKTLF